MDIIFDNQPKEIIITEVFQKWGGLKISYTGEHEIFKELVDSVYLISQKMCEVCGKSGRLAIIDGWETTFCDEHYNASQTIEKYRG